jgi:hypothetical protein
MAAGLARRMLPVLMERDSSPSGFVHARPASWLQIFAPRANAIVDRASAWSADCLLLSSQAVARHSQQPQRARASV